MRYLIIMDGKPFVTDWYSYENNYVEGMIVYDLVKFKWTNDGINYETIGLDHL